jgi:hypothetical protein
VPPAPVHAAPPASPLNPTGGLWKIDTDILAAAIKQCEADMSVYAGDAPATASFMWRNEPDSMRRDYMLICNAYTKGKLATASQK